MRGLIKATHYYSTLEARRDWEAVCQIAARAGIVPPVLDVNTMGHRRIDREIEKLLVRAGSDWEALRRERSGA